jgi:hypothetical protein
VTRGDGVRGRVLQVVFVAFGWVGEDFVGFDDFAESVDGEGVRGVVWVVLFDEVEVLFLDFLEGGVAWEIEDVIGCGVGVRGPGDCGCGLGGWVCGL